MLKKARLILLTIGFKIFSLSAFATAASASIVVFYQPKLPTFLKKGE